MYTIGLDLSRNQISKMKKGRPVRVKKGKGCNLIVNPNNYNIVSRAFRKNKGVDIVLSPEEIALNMAPSPEQQMAYMAQTNTDMASREAVGAGLNWGSIGKTFKKIAPTIVKEASKYAPKVAEELTKAGMKAYGVEDEEKIKRYSKHAGTAAKIGANALNKAMGNGLFTFKSGHGLGAGMGAGLGTGMYAGQGLGGLGSYGNMLAHHAGIVEGDMNDARHIANSVARKLKTVNGNYVRPINTMNMIQGRGVNMSSQHQALQPQPYGANYQFKFFLPPQYQGLQDLTSD